MSTAVSGTQPTEQRRELEADLESQLGFQRRWRLFSMTGYVATTIGMLLGSTGATLFAAKGLTDVAALLSAVATILIGIEKSLLFREKWKFHLLMFTKLNVLRANLHLGKLDVEQAADEFTSILSSYASELPMAAREQA
jgi:hypothetical protein